MKSIRKKKYNRVISAMLLFVMLFSLLPVPVRAENSGEINIYTAEDFAEFAENCKTDGWSLGKVVVLRSDIDISGLDLDGIAYFNGTFRGCGYTISFTRMQPVGSHYGLFRYIGSNGIVRDLNVCGSIYPKGSASEIGGIAGVNQGMILHCTFSGSVRGENRVGGIAGNNTETGIIVNSENSAILLATNSTGGIAGVNQGLISDCRNQGNINIKELETTMDIGGVVDVGTLNLARNVVNRNNMGGIAGISGGVISGCTNTGIVGFLHTGYNVGGIAGNQNGMIIDCTNEGAVYGRKDVGGIVGQAVPFMEATYLSDQVDVVRGNVSRLNNTLNGVVGTISDTAQEGREYADQMNARYQEEWEQVSQNIVDILDSVSDNTAAVSEYKNNILKAVEEITSQNELLDHNLTMEEIRGQIGEESGGQIREQIEEQIREQISQNRVNDSAMQEAAQKINDNLNIIYDNLQKIQEQYDLNEASEEEFRERLTADLENSRPAEDISQFLTIIDRGRQDAAEGINSAVGQINAALDSADEELTTLRENGLIMDVSEIASAESAKGIVTECFNRGDVNGDINVGGIAGTMNIEYSSDPETDFSLTDGTNVMIRTTVSDVIMNCSNLGSVNAKKNHAGGIVGYQTLGLIYCSEAYGYVAAEAGREIGGITGYSEASVKNCYSLCLLSGGEYIGGICGYGTTIEDCISICEVLCEGECIGAVAGTTSEEGNRAGNLFVSDTLEGIDGISYTGVAEHRTYEEIMQLDGIPEDFHQIRVEFMLDGSMLEEQQLAYGGILNEDSFPEAPVKDGYYVQWDYCGERLTGNAVITAEYIPWVEALGSVETDETGRSDLLAIGEFYHGDRLVLTEITPELLQQLPVTEQSLLRYAYQWEIVSERNDQYPAEIECHFAAINPAEAQLFIRKDNTWVNLSAEQDGNYLVATIPYGTEFAVIENAPASVNYVIIAGGIAILLVVFLLIRKIRRVRGKKRGSSSEKSQDKDEKNE
ncbi:MAG: hypothetical protein ACI4DW_06695 [Lachnospiraceae bacterium]